NLILSDPHIEAHLLEGKLVCPVRTDGRSGAGRIAKNTLQHAPSDRLTDHCARREPRKSEKGVEAVNDLGGLRTGLGRLGFPQFEEFHALGWSNCLVDLSGRVYQQLPNALVNHRLFFLVECRLQWPASHGDPLDSEPSAFHPWEPHLGVELQK